MENYIMKLKIYDSNENFIGEYVGDFIEETKDSIQDTSSSGSFFEIIATLMTVAVIKFPWLLFLLAIFALFKITWKLVKLFGILCFHLSKPVIAIGWWLIRMIFSVIICVSSFVVFGILFMIQLPFTYFIHKEMPEMHELFLIIPEWWYPDW